LFGLAVTDAKQGFVFLEGSVLLREGARGGRAFGHVLVAVHASDECVQPAVHVRQRNVHVKAQARCQPIELVPENCGCERPAGSLVDRFVLDAAKPPVHVHRRVPHGVPHPEVCAVEHVLRRRGWYFVSKLRGHLKRRGRLDAGAGIIAERIEIRTRDDGRINERRIGRRADRLLRRCKHRNKEPAHQIDSKPPPHHATSM